MKNDGWFKSEIIHISHKQFLEIKEWLIINFTSIDQLQSQKHSEITANFDYLYIREGQYRFWFKTNEILELFNKFITG